MPDDQGRNYPDNPTPEEARQGEIGTDGHVRGPMRYVLIVSLILVVIAFVVAYLVV